VYLFFVVTTAMDALPEELWMTVLGFLDVPALVHLRLTNVFLRRLALDDRWARKVAAYRRTADYLRKRRRAMVQHYGPDFRPCQWTRDSAIGPRPALPPTTWSTSEP
jgi:hypothetical protein